MAFEVMLAVCIIGWTGTTIVLFFSSRAAHRKGWAEGWREAMEAANRAKLALLKEIDEREHKRREDMAEAHKSELIVERALWYDKGVKEGPSLTAAARPRDAKGLWIKAGDADGSGVPSGS